MDMKKQAAGFDRVFTTTISSRGQIVLPAPMRARLGLRRGTRISIALSEEEPVGIVLRPITAQTIRDSRGSMPDLGAAIDYLERERKRERERGR